MCRYPRVRLHILAVVTLRAFTRGKSFYLGKILLGKFTSGFIFPRLKGHTGDHWTFGGLTSQRIKFQLACSKWLENQSDQREVFILISLLFITLFQRARRARVILLQRLISRRIQRRPPLVYHGLLAAFRFVSGDVLRDRIWIRMSRIYRKC